MPKLKNHVTVTGNDVWNACAQARGGILPENVKQHCSQPSETLHWVWPTSSDL